MLEKIKAIAEDIISDKEWVNDSHSAFMYEGVKDGVNTLIRRLESTNLKKFISIQDLRDELQLRGYFTENLWSVYDVMDKYECERDEALGILDKALTNEVVMEQIWLSIDIFAENKDLKEINE